MKKTAIIVTVLIVTGIIIASCGKKTDQKPLNPNGDSELAVVMRTMMEHGKKLKGEVENKTSLSAYPDVIKSITTAKPTDGMIEDRNVFNGMANYYLATLDSVYLPGVDTRVQFNHLVKSCVDCHLNYCQGPIPAIKELYISSK